MAGMALPCFYIVIRAQAEFAQEVDYAVEAAVLVGLNPMRSNGASCLIFCIRAVSLLSATPLLGGACWAGVLNCCTFQAPEV